MALTSGETYRCSDPHCGAEIVVVVVVVAGSGEAGGDFLSRCCCGDEMDLVEAALEDSRTANA